MHNNIKTLQQVEFCARYAQNSATSFMVEFLTPPSATGVGPKGPQSSPNVAAWIGDYQYETRHEGPWRQHPSEAKPGGHELRPPSAGGAHEFLKCHGDSAPLALTDPFRSDESMHDEGLPYEKDQKPTQHRSASERPVGANERGSGSGCAMVAHMPEQQPNDQLL